MRPFFLHIVRKGKRNYKTKQERKDKAREQAKDNRSSESKRETKGRINTRAKRQKERQTRRKPLNRLTVHAHKRPTSHAKHPNNTDPHPARETL